MDQLLSLITSFPFWLGIFFYFGNKYNKKHGIERRTNEVDSSDPSRHWLTDPGQSYRIGNIHHKSFD